MRPLSANVRLFICLTMIASAAIAGALTTNPVLCAASDSHRPPALLYRSVGPFWFALGIGTGVGAVLTYWVARQLGFQDPWAFLWGTLATGVLAGALSARRPTSLLWRLARALAWGLIFPLGAYSTLVTFYLLLLFIKSPMVFALPIGATAGGTLIALATWWLDSFADRSVKRMYDRALGRALRALG